ncbi:MAG: hypothetical protein U9Q70_04675 [Chloroflexota bacterium]|nr:hypothetical protein [Chloroflexota bacterium]
MNNRSWLLAVAILSLLLGLGLFLVWQLGQTLLPSREPVTVKWAGLAAPIPLAEAEARAVNRAQAWQADVELIKVEASWRPSSDLVTVKVPLTGWTFYYYSPAEKAIVTVTIREEQLFWVPPFNIPGDPKPLTPFPPPYGIEVAWLNFRAGGGADFLESHTEALVQYQLRQTPNGPIWQIAAITERETFQIDVAATTGLVLTTAE